MHIAYYNHRSPPDRHKPTVPQYHRATTFPQFPALIINVESKDRQSSTPSFQFSLAQSHLPDNGWKRARPLFGGCLSTRTRYNKYHTPNQLGLGERRCASCAFLSYLAWDSGASRIANLSWVKPNRPIGNSGREKGQG